MRLAEKRTLLNMEELNQVIGGVTYKYGNYSVVIPDDEKEPYSEAMRLFVGGIVYQAKKSGKTLEEAQNMYGRSTVTDEVVSYYWDRTFINN